MKKGLLFIILISLSTVIYCQNENTKSVLIQNQLDSLIRKYDIKNIEVTSPHDVCAGPSSDFKLERGFLIVNKMYYFNLDKVVSFYFSKRAFHATYYMSFVFN
jgi:hypothetical protein